MATVANSYSNFTMMHPVFKVGFLMVVMATLTLPLPVIAQTIQCKRDGNTAQLKKCAADDYAVADKRLNQVYQQLIGQLKGEQKQRLIQAQRTWIQFRDQNCRFVSSQALGGTAEGLFLTTCLTKVTQQRTQDLQNYISEFNK